MAVGTDGAVLRCGGRHHVFSGGIWRWYPGVVRLGGCRAAGLEDGSGAVSGRGVTWKSHGGQMTDDSNESVPIVSRVSRC
ncbi:hypothetical protein THER5_2028 [Bifidobacterium thermacidophilum subsp. thermacidophilum]|uniref:Uncharacterized protein n=1 Tax=Bifidobacterium thermacidophilum subsp. thermacidophilum TaxID=79262 RepID=A0A087E322_9BIFI|nr:hypothetical protein THER5_2028 [Bifidobacterium thermacidophilum subsp. thermacidophilum]